MRIEEAYPSAANRVITDAGDEEQTAGRVEISVVTDDGSTQSGSLIDEIVRAGARRMLAAALEAEVSQYIAELAAETDQVGHRLVVPSGHIAPGPWPPRPARSRCGLRG